MDFYKSDNASFEKLNLTIADLIDGTDSTRYRFKAYLDESEVSYQIMEQNLAYTPLSFVNDKVHTRTTQKVKLKFNIYSEDFTEAQENYNQLHKLIESIKPKFSLVREQYLPDVRNNTGLLSVKFKGLPKISKKYGDDLVIHLSQFTYDINKELGYIERPFSGAGYTGGDNRLIPIAYVLNIAGQILLPFKETVRVDPKPEETNILGEAFKQATTAGGLSFDTSKDTDYKISLLNSFEKFAAEGGKYKTIESLPDPATRAKALEIVHYLKSYPNLDECVKDDLSLDPQKFWNLNIGQAELERIYGYYTDKITELRKLIN
jgi:hypothetical protein